MKLMTIMCGSSKDEYSSLLGIYSNIYIIFFTVIKRKKSQFCRKKSASVEQLLMYTKIIEETKESLEISRSSSLRTYRE